jgi:hypothetical protein
MASIKEKLSQLGRPMVEKKIMSRDETQELTVWYQCLTTLRERILREAMKEQYELSINRLKMDKQSDGMSLYDKWKLEFEAVGVEKCARFIVASDAASIRTDTLREMSREPLTPGSSKEDEAEWIAEFTPIFERLVEENVDAIKDSPIGELAEKAVELQIESQANKEANDQYRLRLIQESLLEPDETTPGKYKFIFDDAEEVESLLAPSTIEDLSSEIAEEVRKTRERPLKSASTNS